MLVCMYLYVRYKVRVYGQEVVPRASAPRGGVGPICGFQRAHPLLRVPELRSFSGHHTSAVGTYCGVMPANAQSPQRPWWGESRIELHGHQSLHGGEVPALGSIPQQLHPALVVLANVLSYLPHQSTNRKRVKLQSMGSRHAHPEPVRSQQPLLNHPTHFLSQQQSVALTQTTTANSSRASRIAGCHQTDFLSYLR